MPNPAAVLYEAWRDYAVAHFSGDMLEETIPHFDKLDQYEQAAWWAVVGAIPQLSDPSKGAQLDA